MKNTAVVGFAALLVTVGYASPRHIELVQSSPAADTVLVSPPEALVLTFSAELDFAQTAATMRNADGQRVELGDAQRTDDPRQVKLAVVSEMGPGTYTVSWVAAPKDDHGGRGRFSFTVQ